MTIEMVWLADSTKLALAIAGLGLVGVLVGGLIGLTGTLVTTSRQITRQERNARRAVYADYLARALEIQSLAIDQAQAYNDWCAAVELSNHLLWERDQPQNASAQGYIDAKWREAHEGATARGAALEALVSAYRPTHQAFLHKAHELKIIAPPVMHQAAMNVYESIGLLMRYEIPEHPWASRLMGRSLQHFSALARSEVSSRESESWSRVKRRVSPEVEAVSTRITRAHAAVLSYPPQFAQHLMGESDVADLPTEPPAEE